MNTISGNSGTVPNPAVRIKTDPYWWDSSTVPEFDTDASIPQSCDVVVIGGGLTGLSAALTLANAGKTVIVLDTGIPGQGASARNGGMIGGGHRLSVDAMHQKFGPALAKRLLKEAHLDAAQYTISLIDQYDIRCDLNLTGRFRGFFHSHEYDSAALELEKLQKLVDVAAFMVPHENQQSEVNTDLYRGGVVFESHGGINPAKLVWGLLSTVLESGVQVFGLTSALDISRADKQFVVESSRGKIYCGDVLTATNGYTPGFLTYVKKRVFPIPSFVVATEPLGETAVRALIPNSRMIVESRDRHCYFRPSPDGQRLIFGGRAAMMPVPEKFARKQLTGLIKEIFPELANVGITHSWHGYTGFTFDFLPHIGCHDGIWHATGYSGSGNAMAPWLGHQAALTVLGDKNADSAFRQTPFSKRWWYQGWPWFRPAADALYRIRDFHAGLSRDR